jgi:hypothetical protein
MQTLFIDSPYAARLCRKHLVDDVENNFPALHYVLVDDKLRLLHSVRRLAWPTAANLLCITGVSKSIFNPSIPT